jgi:hypothetical protein
MMKCLTLALLVIGAALTLTACAAVIDSEGAKIGDPKAFAEATHIARLSQEAAFATATSVALDVTRQVENIKAQSAREAQTVKATATAQAIVAFAAQQQADKIKSQADIERTKAEAEQNALPAASAGKALGYFGLGAGALVLAVGLAFGVVAWVNKRAATVYPDARGQFPVIVRRGLGWVAFHDPNRALGPATVVRTPTALDALAGVAIATVKALKQGDTPSLPTAEPAAAFPLPGSEPTMLQVATQAQAAQVRIAENSGRPKLMFMTGIPEPARPSAARGRMPQVTMINDPAQIESFEQKLLTGGGDE